MSESRNGRTWWSRGQAPSSTDSAARVTRSAAAEELLERARALAKDPSSFEQALGTYRDAVEAYDFDATVMLDYARFLIRNSRGSTAEEVLALALARNGALIDALEMYLELVRELDLPAHRATWALNQLRADIAANPASHRAALDYAVPHRMVDVLDTVGAGPDRVNRAIVQINQAYMDGSFSEATLAAAGEGLGANDVVRAHLTVALARGNRTVATELLKNADPRAIPQNALRRAIRRARGAGKDKQVIQYVEEYRKLLPNDGWAKRLQDEYQRNAVSNYQLGRTGFPFPTMRSKPLYEAQKDHVFYLLHNSLPHNSAGYATRTHGLLSELNRIGWNVDGVTRLGYPYDMPGKAELPDVPLHDVVGNVDYRRLLTGRQVEKKNPLFYYTERYSKALLELAKQERPAIIHAASNHWNGLTAVKTARQLGIPSIYEVRGLWEVTRGSRNPEWAQSNMFKYIARMEADAAKGATRVFAITEALRDEMISRGVDGDKINIVPNGVDTSRFTPIPKDEELASQLGVAGKTVIGYVGSVLDYEGIELMLEAAEVMNRTREDFHVLIVGDGAELERFQNYVEEHELEHVVTFTGRVPHEDVERYYSLIDITPFPRLSLPVCEMVSPLKPFEAMAMGKAVVSSDVAALKEIVTPGVNGYLHEKGSTESLIEQLTRLLDDPEHTRLIGAQARDWVVENRDWKLLAQVIANEYSRVAR
ncbi:glycosyltransferase [Brachybacterium fresconis]|uniref:D-inositol 3-phosphate glycosyltransferase n=1 Tax=Brachybacterium fresconis TaxID=173363 RepID=A0ABS4YMB3_9MICO|nr:glycosyltransferase involved in cell wall biosynthesis [Brachybacterium fresconis]